MTIPEAQDLLLAHAGAHPDPDHPLLANGFLGMLRPYHGLVERNFHEVMHALQVVAPSLQTDPTLNRNLMAALWGLCHFSRAWALEPEGMVRSNNLITEADVERLSNWLNIISYAITNLLEGADDKEAFELYTFYQLDAAASLSPES